MAEPNNLSRCGLSQAEYCSYSEKAANGSDIISTTGTTRHSLSQELRTARISDFLADTDASLLFHKPDELRTAISAKRHRDIDLIDFDLHQHIFQCTPSSQDINELLADHEAKPPLHSVTPLKDAAYTKKTAKRRSVNEADDFVHPLTDIKDHDLSMISASERTKLFDLDNNVSSQSTLQSQRTTTFLTDPEGPFPLCQAITFSSKTTDLIIKTAKHRMAIKLVAFDRKFYPCVSTTDQMAAS